ncbi:hypothetical protein H9P43_010159 [Blastocladiella emersonii ATCC 22665]|nr:hypothetical protein H9P43_010159 [Blastocladiella emersonii ATCC 22665]
MNFPYFWRSMPDDPQQGLLLAQFLRNTGWTMVNVISSGDSYGQSLMASFTSSCSQMGITFASKHIFLPGQSNMSAALDTIKATATGITVILSISYIFSLAGGASDAVALRVTDRVMFSFPHQSPYNANYTAFLQKWDAAFPGVDVEPYTTLYLDCLYMVARGLVKLSNMYGPAAVTNRTYPHNLNDFLDPFAGYSGSVKFTKAGERIGAFGIYRYEAGKTVLVQRPDLNGTLVPVVPLDGILIPISASVAKAYRVHLAYI